MEKKLNSFVVAGITIILLFSILVFLIFCLGKMNNDISSSELVEKSIREIEVDTDRTICILPTTEDMGTDYLDKIVFLGESTTYGLWRYGVLSCGMETTQVWTGATCIDGKTQCAGTLSLSPSIANTKIYFPEDQSAITISDAITRRKPEYLVITLGLNNGASYYSEDQFKQCYRMLLNSIINTGSNTKIILQSIFPVSSNCKISAYTPQRIVVCNSWIQDLATEYDLKYLDTISVLSNEDGYLFPEYDNGGDGIHLNKSGLLTVLQYIRTHGYFTEEES